MQLLARLAGPVALLALCTAAAQAEVRSSVSYLSYQVEGESLSAVWRDIGDKAAQVLRDARSQAETRIRYRWQVGYAAAGSGCLAKQPIVSVAVRIILPEWRSARSAPPAAQAAWQTYRRELLLHEEQHHAIALETAQKLYALLRDAPRDRSCNDLAKVISRDVERILAEERWRQSHYDRISWPIRLF